ncbi:membrane protein insertase YidC [Croceicoccus mobilis]|uniref:Membrane protein insertase YidC n=1 Tax=Croceicoccus mobilis TaxID=1703339 RepID=A0A917DQM2_9SPHN|nr:membrane protein insertase YidC [Croceicoccus mobilis]GGD61534.1 membrane protein insertase YidC [Croceicoccus mobilis]
MENQRNIIVALVLVALLLFGWDSAMQYFYPQPTEPVEQTTVDPTVTTTAAEDEAPTSRGRDREGGLKSASDIETEERDLATALVEADRVKIEAPAISGSINPVGARIDDLTLNRHTQTVAKDSPPVRLFSPDGTPAQYFTQFGWVGQGVSVPDANTVWQTEGGPLSPDSPVTLTWNNGEGQRFGIELTVDDNYLITAKQTVANTGSGPVVVQPYGFINRTSRTASDDIWNVQSGPIYNLDGSVEFGTDYDDVDDAKVIEEQGQTDWLGFTDIYWLSTLIPSDASGAEGTFRALGNEHYRADLIYDPVTIQPGKQYSRTTQLFAGAKESEVLSAYEKQGINNFSFAIDWGWFFWFEKPILWLLKALHSIVGNFGVAIILLTVIVRGVMFPIAQKQFASMASMKAIQPKLKALQERHKDDKQQLQQEMMKLYKEEKVNPLAGCLPMFLQIPVFFALYKVLLIAIDTRHQPFILWIKDLSAPDPLHILNLFGLLDFQPPSFLAIGVLALLLGITMFLQFKLNPAQMDPAQQQVFMIMPWVLMFVMAPFAAGLLIYWITSNTLTIAQQQYLYSRHPQLKEAAAREAEEKKRKAEEAKAKG